MSGRLYNYARAMRSKSDYNKRLTFLSNSIFGNLRRPVTPGTKKMVQMLTNKPYHQRNEIVHYYPAVTEATQLMKHLRAYGLFRDEHQDFKEEMLRMRAMRGKGRGTYSERKGNKK